MKEIWEYGTVKMIMIANCCLWFITFVAPKMMMVALYIWDEVPPSTWAYNRGLIGWRLFFADVFRWSESDLYVMLRTPYLLLTLLLIVLVLFREPIKKGLDK